VKTVRNKPNLLTAEQVFKRAGGCRRYNRQRQTAADERRSEVWRLLDIYGHDRRGTQARIARELNVSRATICRDVAGYNLTRWMIAHPVKGLRLLAKLGLW
jgi:hypothetical protein